MKTDISQLSAADAVHCVLGEVLQRDPASVSNDDNLSSGLGLDGLHLIQSLVHLEAGRGIEFSDEEALAWVTVGDIVTSVEAHIQRPQPSQ